jgi:hypothetical protein
MEQPKLTLALAGLVIAGVLVGCGLSNPYQPSDPHASPTPTSSSTSTTSSAAEAGDPPAERHGTVPPQTKARENRIRRAAATSSARAAVDRYARLYINWHAGQLVAHQRELAQRSIGAARLQAAQVAASASADTQLRSDRVSDRGQIVSANPGVGPAAGKWVIVTSEKTSGQGDYTGLPPAIHVTYAVVTRITAGWVVSQWTPQN